MKVRVTLLTENEKPVSVLGDNPEPKIKSAWELVLALIMTQNPKERVTVENVEVLKE